MNLDGRHRHDDERFVVIAERLDGEPDRLRLLASRLREQAEMLDDQTRRLESSVNPTWRGPAADGFRERRAGLVPLLAKSSVRYRMVGVALEQYWPALLEAKAKAQHARQLATEANANAGSSSITNLSPGAEVNACLDRARALFVEAVDLRDRAARRCAAQISEAIADGLVDPRPWTRLGNALSLENVAQIASVMSTAMSLVALVVPALAPLAAGVALVSIGVHALMATSGDSGQRRRGRSGMFDGMLNLGGFGAAQALKAAVRAKRASDGSRIIGDLRATNGVAGSLARYRARNDTGLPLRGAAKRQRLLGAYKPVVEVSSMSLRQQLSGFFDRGNLLPDVSGMKASIRAQTMELRGVQKSGVPDVSPSATRAVRVGFGVQFIQAGNETKKALTPTSFGSGSKAS